MKIEYIKGYLMERGRLIFLSIFLLGFLVVFYALEYGDGIHLYPCFFGIVVIVTIVLGDFLMYMSQIKKLRQYHPLSNLNQGLAKAILDEYKVIEQEHIDGLLSLKEEHKEEQRFLSQWIHNMKSPISVMELCQEEKGSDKTAIDQSITEELDRLNHMLNMTLYYIRLDDFKEDFLPTQVNLVDEVRKAINEQKNALVYNHCYPKLHVEKNEIIIRTDGKWHQFVLQQLMSNAIKYSTGPNKNIDFTIEEKEGCVQLTIEDQGMGILKADIGRVFDAFFTGENGRKIKGSTGIGLYISKRVLDALNHKIHIESQVGIGTKVVISYLTTL